MKKPVERRPAAILAADVAGYSRLMGADEEGTLERLKAHRRQLVEPKIREHRGRIVKTTGDGMLVQFPSVVARSAIRSGGSEPGGALSSLVYPHSRTPRRRAYRARVDLQRLFESPLSFLHAF